MNDRIDIVLAPGVTRIVHALAERGHDALLVGGVVRDALLGKTSLDYDVVTTAGPEEVRAACEGLAEARVYPLGERFGTMGVAVDDYRVEISRYRPDALGAATTADRFAIDASHRDFTVNAIGFDPLSSRLIDPLGGARDIAAGLLRAPGDPDDRFAEDPLRVLRAGRFVSELGFALDDATRDALPAHAPSLADVAAERIREELGKTLVGSHSAEGLRVLLRSGALEVVLPEVAALEAVSQPSFHDLDVLEHTLQTVELAPATRVLRWAALLHDVGKAPTRTVEADGRIRFFRHAQEGAKIAEQICRRLRMSAADTAAIVHLVAEHMRLGDVNLDDPRSVDRAVRKLDLVVAGSDRMLATAEDALDLTLADFSATAHREEAPLLRERLGSSISASRARGTATKPRSPLSGDELMQALSLTEGTAVGVAKRAIEIAVEAGEIEAGDREAALRVARGALGI